MKNIKPTISIGISAYNEEKNIAALLMAILKQRRANWTLKEVLVYCDGCSDNTAREARSIKSKYIRVIDDGLRKGKVGRVSQMCQECIGDIFILFDADITFHDEDVIRELVTGFEADQRVMLVGGNTRPIAPTAFFERSVYSTFEVFDQARKTLKHGHNIFGCTGACIALKKKFARTLSFPNVINEDDFIYFSCLSKGFLFRHVPTAIVYYKLPKTLKDYLKQVFRSNPEAVSINFRTYFGDLVNREYHRPIRFYLKCVLVAFKRHPMEVAYISLVNLTCKPAFSIISKKYKLEWYTAQSTK